MAQPHSLLLLLPLSVLFVLGAARTPQEPTQGVPPITSYQEGERARLEAGLPGIWAIVAYDAPGRTIDQQRVSGYVFLQDGFASITVQAQSLEQGVLGQELQVFFQGTVHRYRIGPLLKLQLASIMGFSNMNDEGAIELVGNHYVREHSIALADDQLTLTNEAGGRMVLRRVGKSDFPQAAEEFLRRNPGGIPVGGR